MTKKEIDKYLDSEVIVGLKGNVICGLLDTASEVLNPVQDYAIYSDYSFKREFRVEDVEYIKPLIKECREELEDERNSREKQLNSLIENIKTQCERFSEIKNRYDELIKILGEEGMKEGIVFGWLKTNECIVGNRYRFLNQHSLKVYLEDKLPLTYLLKDITSLYIEGVRVI